jgi:hypothetical protein
VFNYGIFDFSKPNFIYRFAKGETDYMLSAYSFNYFLTEYIERGSEVIEQTLNLLPSEKETLWQALAENALPQNRVYRYNFFFDNCATRPEAIIEGCMLCKLSFAPVSDKPSFRDVINYCTRNHAWVTFGCDIVLGLPTDRRMSFRERFFLPSFLRDAIATAKRGDSAEMFVENTRVLNTATLSEAEKDLKYHTTFTPFICATLLLALIMVLTITEWRLKKYFRYVDVLLFLIAGTAGCVLFFLCFVSVHPSIFPNISVLWLHPFHLVAALLFVFKRRARWYHVINLSVISLMLIVWYFIPQRFNPAFVPLIACLWLRSASAIISIKFFR